MGYDKTSVQRRCPSELTTTGVDNTSEILRDDGLRHILREGHKDDFDDKTPTQEEQLK